MAVEKQTMKPLGNYFWHEPPDENKWADCVHCGLCLEACPTYEITGQEQHSPRGRVHLIKSVAEGKLLVDEDFADPMFACLDCRACTTACPADVQVGGLIEEVRGQIRQAMPLKGFKGVIAKGMLEKVFPSEKRMHSISGLLRFYQKTKLKDLARKTKLIKILPSHLEELESILPEASISVRKKYKAQSVIPAKGDSKGTVALLTGCIMDVLFSDVNEATIQVLTRNGNDVVIPQGQTCCGALHVHAGDRNTGRKLAKRNIEAFEKCERVIVNAAGCGSMLKEYPELFRDDFEWYERAVRFSQKVEDVSKFLVDTDFKRPNVDMNMRITYHDACHLAHGQGIRHEPRKLLREIPGIFLQEMDHADRCCGSAGIYNITHPEMAMDILESKMENVPEDVEVIAMGNPGCMLQMALGVKKTGGKQKVVHTVQLLEWAYQREEKGGDDHR